MQEYLLIKFKKYKLQMADSRPLPLQRIFFNTA